ncbi:MAG: Nif3-like dinuclear metal center hexameric protein [Candidatus Kapaibacteriota bacterium]
MELTEFLGLVQLMFPPSVAMQGDPIGLHVDSVRSTANRVLVAMELTDDVLDEAVQDASDTIVVFHPLVYRPLSMIHRGDRTGRLVANLIRHDIALVVVHTSFDSYPHGTNALLAQRLGLHHHRPLVPDQRDGFGMGLLVQLPSPIPFAELIERVHSTCGSPVRYCPAPTDQVERIAIVGGSGMSFYPAAIDAQADVLITADIRYHDFHAATGRIGLIDPGHYEMEQFVAEGIVAALRPHVPASVTLSCSTVVTNPVHYNVRPLPTDSYSHH